MSPCSELQQVNEDCFRTENQISMKQEIEELVVFVRLELYNQDLFCGPKAIRKRLEEFYFLKPLLSESTIGRILAKRCLTYQRTSFYE